MNGKQRAPQKKTKNQIKRGANSGEALKSPARTPQLANTPKTAIGSQFHRPFVRHWGPGGCFSSGARHFASKKNRPNLDYIALPWRKSLLEKTNMMSTRIPPKKNGEIPPPNKKKKKTGDDTCRGVLRGGIDPVGSGKALRELSRQAGSGRWGALWIGPPIGARPYLFFGMQTNILNPKPSLGGPIIADRPEFPLEASSQKEAYLNLQKCDV